jgi:hypothetical protein
MEFCVESFELAINKWLNSKSFANQKISFLKEIIGFYLILILILNSN